MTKIALNFGIKPVRLNDHLIRFIKDNQSIKVHLRSGDFFVTQLQSVFFILDGFFSFFDVQANVDEEKNEVAESDRQHENAKNLGRIHVSGMNGATDKRYCTKDYKEHRISDGKYCRKISSVDYWMKLKSVFMQILVSCLPSCFGFFFLC